MKPGYYLYRAPSWKEPIVVKVTDTEVVFDAGSCPIGDISAEATFTPLVVAPKRVFIFYVREQAVAAILDPEGTTAEIVAAYSEENDIPRNMLKYDIVEVQ